MAYGYPIALAPFFGKAILPLLNCFCTFAKKPVGHICVGLFHSFLFITEYSIRWVYHNVFIHSLAVDIWLYIYFFILAIMNTIAMNTYISVFVWTYAFVSLGQISMNEMKGLYRKCSLILKETAKLFSKLAVLFCIPTSNVAEFHCSTSLSTLSIVSHLV